jgi:hypothetical protein
MKSSIRIKRAFCIAALIGSQLVYAQPSAAQSTSPYFQTVHFQVYVFNASDGTAVSGETVFYEENGGQYCRGVRPLGSMYIGAGDTGGDGVADFNVEACPGSATLTIHGGSLFNTKQIIIAIAPGQRSYETRIGLTQKNRARVPSDKYNNQSERTLHIQVRGRLANGTLVPVHFAGVYDRNGRHILTTDYNGDATARVLEVMGETVTVHADGSHWREGTGSFIVGASEGVRITRNDDYVRIVLNGEGDNLTEEATLTFTVHGKSNGRSGWTAVHFATIYDEAGHHLVTTDYAGHGTAHVKAKLGEAYVVKVDGGSRWKPASKDVLIGGAGGIGATVASNRIDFLLEPAQAAKELTVEVLNHETDKPVAAASVTIYKPNHFPGTPVARATTDAHGLAKFDAEEVDSALLNGEARVGATHGGSKSAVQTLAASLLEGESPKYVLYLNEKQETTKWSGTWYNGPYTMQVSGGTGSLGYQFLRSQGEGTCCPLVDQGGGSCTVHGSVATCTENAHYHDSAKDVQRSSDVKLTLSGSIMSSVAKIKTASITLSSGQVCPDISQCTGLHPGAEFSGSWSRTKP